MIVARARFEVAARGFGARPTVSVLAAGDDSYDLRPVVEVEADGAAASMASSGVQVLAWEVRAGGAPVQRLLPSISVERSLTQPGAWSFSVPGDSPHPLGGSILSFGGAAPPGKAAIDISGVYLTPSGRRTTPLITSGITATCSAQDAPAGRIDSLTGLDAAGRCDKALATLTLPPGHGLPRGEVVRRVLAKIGITNVAFEYGAPCYKEIQLRDVAALNWCREYLAAELRTLAVDDRGVWRNPSIAHRRARIDWTWGRGQVLAESGSKWQASSDIPTSVTITGTRQVLRDGAGGRRTEEKETLVYAPRTPVFAAFQQGGAGTLTAYTAPPGSLSSAGAVTLISRVVNRAEYDGETVVSESTTTWGWRNPLAWRYRRQAGTPAPEVAAYHSGVYVFEAGAAMDDTSQAYLWATERFVELAHVETRHSYREDGYRSGSTTTTAGWMLPRWRIKERSGSLPWEETDYEPVYVLGNGEAVGQGTSPRIEHYVRPGLGLPGTVTEVRRETVEIDGGFTLAEVVEVDRLSRREGGAYLYGDGRTYADAFDLLQLAETQVVSYSPEGESRHATVTARYGPTGALLEQQVVRGESGYLPAADRRTDIEPPPETYDESPEFAAAARSASRIEQQPIKSTATLSGAAHLEAWEDKGSSTWAETQEELDALAVDKLRRLTSPTVAVALPCNWLVREGQHATVELDRIPIEILIESVRWQEQAGPHGPGAITTEVSGRAILG